MAASTAPPALRFVTKLHKFFFLPVYVVSANATQVCHHTPWLYLATHAKHHRMKTIRACETICLTFWEEALDVGCSILALNLTKVRLSMPEYAARCACAR